MRKLDNYLKLERHAYAPELNQVHLLGTRRRLNFSAPGVTTLAGARSSFRAAWGDLKLNKTSYYTIAAFDSSGRGFALNRVNTKYMSLVEVAATVRGAFPGHKLDLHKIWL